MASVSPSATTPPEARRSGPSSTNHDAGDSWWMTSSNRWVGGFVVFGGGFWVGRDFGVCG